MIENIFNVVLSSAITAVFVSVILGYFLKRKVEAYKKELELKLEQSISIQSRQREMYEKISEDLEEIFTEESDKLSLKLNKLFGKLALWAPDDVYNSLKKQLEGHLYPEEIKPILYLTMRKAIFGDNTILAEEDLIKHINAKSIKRDK